MTVEANDIWRTIGYLETDTKGLLAKLGELRRLLASVEFPKSAVGFRCDWPGCGIEKTTKTLLDDHRVNVHGVDEYAPAAVVEAAS